MGSTNHYEDFDQALAPTEGGAAKGALGTGGAAKGALGTGGAETTATRDTIQEMIDQFVELSFHEYADVRCDHEPNANPNSNRNPNPDRCIAHNSYIK